MSDIKRLGAKFANYRQAYDGIYVRVICPVCNMGGAQRISSCQPKCHICKYKVLMQPADNTQIVCTWDEAVEFNRLRL